MPLETYTVHVFLNTDTKDFGFRNKKKNLACL